jgi:hypothetical protein
MLGQWFMVHDGLVRTTRLPSLTRSRSRVSAGELLVLLACGAAAAAAVAFVKLGLRIPGHSIVLAALPMALGISLAPRRLGGAVMSLGALSTGLLLSATGAARFGAGSLVSLGLLGPMMDLAFRGVRSGWRVYAALVLSGLVTNLLAMASRAAPKLLGVDVAGGRSFADWWLQASYTYALSGIVAGLLGAIFWFQLKDRPTGALGT